MEVKILVVDDSLPDRLTIKNFLSEYSILTACDGMEAMRVLKEHDGINIIILNLRLPDMSGFQFLQSLKEDERLRKIRIIILTNSDELNNEIKGLRLGATDFVRKPLHKASLKTRIDVHASLLRAEFALEQRVDAQTITFDMIFKQAPIGIAISQSSDPKHSDQVIVRVNPVYEQITGRTKEELFYTGWEQITHPDDLEEDMKNLKKLHAGEIQCYSMEKRYIKPDGSVVWVYMVVAALTPGNNNKLNHICLIQDITERKQIEIERKYISEHDRLTGLYNRDYLELLFASDAKQKKSLQRAFVGINLINVQSITANYGFIYTQGLIKKIAEILRQYCTDKCILFHTHENRFVFYFVHYKDKNELIDFSNAITEALESQLATDRIGGGIGVLELEQDQYEADIDIVLRRLLIASERSISLFGKNFETCFYDQELEALVTREREVMEALIAIATDECTQDELFLQYQPVVNLKTGSVCGFEALARLSTEKLGMVPPAEFIPIAEKTKLIIPIGEKVIVKAFRFMNKLKELGYDAIKVSINTSAIQLLSPDFTCRMFEMIDQMQVNIRNIVIEITESVFTSDYEKINKIIEKLRETGMHIAIDDFGTGYSSLARENELRADSLKIDKCFIDKLSGEELDKAITSDIISIAHKLGHSAIAEGVEHDEQLQYLKKHGCDKIQGYLISKPLDEQAALEFLKKHV